MATQTDPSALPTQQSDCVLVGVNSRGNWIARDAFGTRGGIFVSCAAALSYARLEFRLRTLPIVMSDGNIELDLSHLAKEREQPTDPSR
jgi:hypothetical protein